MLPQAASNFDWFQIADHQRYAVLRRGGLMNLAALPSFALVWAAVCLLVYTKLEHEWLLLPATISLWFALGLFRRYRLIVDTPTSSLSSSAQGYVELSGTVHLPEGESYRGLPNLPATVWLPGYVENEPFVLDDGYGRCLLFPQKAEIITRPGNTHFSWLHAIYPGQTLYALGELRTHGGDNIRVNRSARLVEVLVEWKAKPQLLLQSFDANSNGQIDPDEWQSVRTAAERWVEEDIHEQKLAPGMHIMDGANAGQLFLITNILPEVLAARYRWASLLHTLAWLGLMLVVQVGV